MKRWLMEPMLHFFLAGALLFAAYGWLKPGDAGQPRFVRISAAEVNWLRETWTRQWHHPPDNRELRGLVLDYLKEGLLASEARELGMDENDTIVCRRLAQKMEFLVQNTAQLAEPVEEELRRLYSADLSQYQTPARISFTQIYFKTEVAARRSLRQLENNGAARIGEPTLLERDYADTDEQTVTNLFGQNFAGSIVELEAGRWHGPFASAYGFHLVLISERQGPQQRDFKEVRPELLEKWHRKQQARAYADYVAALFKKYEVIVEWDEKPPLDLLAKGIR